MTENEIAKITVNICFTIYKNMEQGILKVFMKKYLFMNGTI